MTKAKKPRATKDDGMRKAHRATAQAQGAPICEAGDPMPVGSAEFRRALMRRMMTSAHMWRRCREPICRRVKQCVGETMRCREDMPRRKRTPQQEARILADLKRALERRLAEESR